MKSQVLLNRQEQAATLTELGDYLRRFRQQQGLSLEQVALKTLIPIRTLRAIEAGHLEHLPEPVYIQGFIRRYADALGMDGSEFAIAFPTGLAITPRRALWNLSVRTQLRPLHLYLLYLGLVALAVGGLSHLLNRSAPIVVTVPLGTELTPVPASLSGAPPLGPMPQAPKAPAAKPPVATKPVRVGLTLTDQSWLRVVADGKTEFEGVLREGEHRTWAATQAVTVRAGNAGGVMVSFNEGQSKPLGAPGSVEEVTFGSQAQTADGSNLNSETALTVSSTVSSSVWP